MKAEEIRAKSESLIDNFSLECSGDASEFIYFKNISLFLAEIAAQLAELNETLKNKSSVPSTEP